jgi:hypothetical protein
MIMKTNLLLLSLPCRVPAFFVAPPPRQHQPSRTEASTRFASITTALGSVETKSSNDRTADPNDKELIRLRGEFKHLQDELLDELAQRDREVDVAEGVAEKMLDKAADAVAFQRYKKLEELDRAKRELEHATGDKMKANALREEARAAALSAERELGMVESVDSLYEDVERVRDLSVAHAAHHLEDDALEMEVESRFQELEAESKMEDAEKAIAELRSYEVRLRESAKQVRQHKTEKKTDAENK